MADPRSQPEPEDEDVRFCSSTLFISMQCTSLPCPNSPQPLITPSLTDKSQGCKPRRAPHRGSTKKQHRAPPGSHRWRRESRESRGPAQRDEDPDGQPHLPRSRTARKLYALPPSPKRKIQTKLTHPTPTDEVIDLLLDQEGFECDPLNRVEGDTPLHSAVRYINSLPLNADTAEFASGLISMMIDAGSDPRIKNRALLTPSQLVDPANVALRRQLADAIDIAQNAGDFVEQADIVDEEEEDLPDEYEGSDSDFDPEEYEREKERRRKAKENKGLM